MPRKGVKCAKSKCENEHNFNFRQVFLAFWHYTTAQLLCCGLSQAPYCLAPSFLKMSNRMAKRRTTIYVHRNQAANDLALYEADQDTKYRANVMVLEVAWLSQNQRPLTESS